MAVLEVLEAENDMLRERIAALESILGMEVPAPVWLGLTPTEARLFGLLAQRQRLSKEQIYRALYELRLDSDQPDIKIIDVLVCNLRKKIEPVGVAITTLWGSGYALSDDAQTRARELLRLERTGTESAA